MIQYLKLLRLIGQFDAVNAGGQLPLAKLALVYAENSRGKTTLAAILRSLKTGDGSLISERHRLAAVDPPQVVLSIDGSPPYVFQSGTWSAALPDVVIFDDVFVAENICSGIEVATQHRQKLHELIVGAQGVALNSTLQGFIEKIEAHNQALRTKADAIPAARRGPLSVDGSARSYQLRISPKRSVRPNKGWPPLDRLMRYNVKPPSLGWNYPLLT